ncbi:hypothetical protein HFO21_16090 [Rhizobium laguerreae]|uniref:hypothetical protein n=1 Tax=Rhizobium laguerreae TaxID=1076926 RepID=UPI001C9049FB|nr:hypothetical protein [Rhizobium laguerreae]MBY3215867.1 hypothetical protein [Rhizobium laguerreae]
MSFLSDAEQQKLKIEKMIVHVVDPQKAFQPKDELPVEGDHVGFFEARIIDVAVSAVHAFTLGSVVRARLEDIAMKRVTFQMGAQEISRLFMDEHKGSASPGAFFIFQLTAGNPDVTFYSLIKYDYREAVELDSANGKTKLRQIVQAFVTEQRAIQKSALVRVENGTAQELVSAFDRMERAPDLTGYFKKFLSVKRNRSDTELSDDLIAVLRETLMANKASLPQEDVPGALREVRRNLAARAEVDNNAVRESIIVAAGELPEDQLANIDLSLSKSLKSKNLSGVTFKPDPEKLTKSVRVRLRTAEDVIVIYPHDQEGVTVDRSVDKEAGGTKIVVTTKKKLIEDEPLPEKSRTALK